jgi:hypothetical protein
MQITPTNRQTGRILQSDGLTGLVAKQFPLNFQSNGDISKSNGESAGSEIECCLELH